MILCSRCKINPRQEKHAYCKPCASQYHKERKRNDPTLGPYLAERARQFREANPERMKELYRRNNLRNSCGATPEWYEQKFKEQKGRCAICRAKARPVRKGGIPRLCSDHDHETGELRALLCVKCNFAISRLEEIDRWHEKALEYLAKFGKSGEVRNVEVYPLS
jgi:hypothetical protein